MNKKNKVCDKCNNQLDIFFASKETHIEQQSLLKNYGWNDDIRAFHIQMTNNSNKNQIIVLEHIFRVDKSENTPTVEILELNPKEKLRHAISRINENNNETRIFHSGDVETLVFDNLDRAYYSLGE